VQQILRRLELIKTSITIGDEEIIKLQIAKLFSMPIDEHLKNILEKLSNSNYGDAIVDIESYMSRYNGLIVYEDKELGGLKLELKVLEAKLQELSEEKNEYLNDLNEFNLQYNLHLGEIIRKILELKKDMLFNQKNDETNIHNDEIHKEYEEAREEFEAFDSEYEDIINIERFELDEDEIGELKKAYRKASKLCHPDIVPDELKRQALKLMQELNEAYNKRDLKKVKEILKMLENGSGFEVGSDSINDKKLLRSKIEDIRNKIDEVINELDEIKEDETFLIIQEVDDLEDYFDTLKIEFQKEYERLQEEENSKIISTNVTKKTDEDDYWGLPF
jgi:hypothetical protein